MADVTQNLEFVFTATDKATPEAAKVTDSMAAMESAAVESADGINGAMVEAIEFLTEAVDDLTKGLTTTKNDLADVEDAAEKSRGRLLSLSGTFNFLKRAAKGFSIGAAIGAGAGVGMKAISGIQRLLAPLFELISEIFGPAMELLSGAFKSQLAPISAALVDLAQEVLPTLMDAFRPLMMGVLGFVQSFSGMITGEDSPLVTLMNTLKTVFTELQPVLTEVFAVFSENAKAMLPVIATLAGILIKTLAPILMTVVKFIGEVVQMVAPFLQKVMVAFAPLLEALGQELGGIIKELATQLLPILEPLLGAVLELLKPLLPIAVVLVRVLGTVLVAALKVLGPLLAYIASFIEYLSAELGAAIQPFVDDFAEWANLLIDDAIPAIELFGEMVRLFFEDGKKNFRILNRYFRQFARIVGDVASDIGEWFSDLWDGITEGWQAVEDFFTTAVATFQAIWDDPIGALQDAFVGAFELIFGSFDEVVADLKGLWSDFLDFLGLGDFEVEINSALDAMLAAVMSPIETMKSLINSTIIDPLNKILDWPIPVSGTPLWQAVGLGGTIPQLQAGGIIRGAESQGGVLANIGEAGPEAVIPLRPSVLDQLLPEVNVTLGADAFAKTGVNNRDIVGLLQQLLRSSQDTQSLLEMVLLSKNSDTMQQVV